MRLILPLIGGAHLQCQTPSLTRPDEAQTKTLAKACNDKVDFSTSTMCKKWSNVPMSEVKLFWTPENSYIEYELKIQASKTEFKEISLKSDNTGPLPDIRSISAEKLR